MNVYHDVSFQRRVGFAIGVILYIAIVKVVSRCLTIYHGASRCSRISTTNRGSYPLEKSSQATFKRYLGCHVNVTNLYSTTATRVANYDLGMTPMNSGSQLMVKVPTPYRHVQENGNVPNRMTNSRNGTNEPTTKEYSKTTTVEGIPMVNLRVIQGLRSIYQVTSTNVNGLVVPRGVLRVFLIPVPIVVPIQANARRVQVDGNIFFNVATIAFRYPISVTKTMVMALGHRLSTIRINESNASYFVRYVLWFLGPAFSKVDEVNSTIKSVKMFLVGTTFYHLRKVTSAPTTFLRRSYRRRFRVDFRTMFLYSLLSNDPMDRRLVTSACHRNGAKDKTTGRRNRIFRVAIYHFFLLVNRVGSIVYGMNVSNVTSHMNVTNGDGLSK